MKVRTRRHCAPPPFTPRPICKPNAVRDISGALNLLLADIFALY